MYNHPIVHDHCNNYTYLIIINCLFYTDAYSTHVISLKDLYRRCKILLTSFFIALLAIQTPMHLFKFTVIVEELK